jgi:hypothetical protein
MKTILLASTVTLAISTCAAFAATSSHGDVSTGTELTSDVQIARQFDGAGAVTAPRGRYVAPYTAPSWSNPTGQVERGPHGAISLFAPTDNGNG